MIEPRKIVLILGNGFDLDLGLKTSYKDFWESSFCPKNYPAPLIHHLNESWPSKRDAVKWYDLENELYNYYKKIHRPGARPDVITSNERTFIGSFDPVRMSFGIDAHYNNEVYSLLNKGYLIEGAPLNGPRYQMPYREDMLKPYVWRDRRALSMIKEGLCHYLFNSQQKDLKKSTSASVILAALDYSRRHNGDFLEIFTFNYTHLPDRFYTIPDEIIHYVHGSCEEGKIIIGTKDDEVFEKNYSFLQKVYDPDFNPPAITESLRKADEIVFFGHSIGSNDRQYFKSFFPVEIQIKVENIFSFFNKSL